ncbi:MAG: DUF1080 domain-containing protein [Verrucomicrobiota bacterium]
MKHPILLTLPIIALAALLTLPALADKKEKSEGFTVLYDGSTLDQLQTTGNWQIQDDGSLYLEPREGEEGWKRYDAYLWFPGEYEDFECDFEYKFEEGGNSGFYFRIADEAEPTQSGFEVQILDSYGKEAATHHDNGGVIKTSPPLVNASIPPGEWNHMNVVLRGSKLTVILNDKKVQEIDIDELRPKDKDLAASGKIAIQDHGQNFWVRNVKIKRL